MSDMPPDKESYPCECGGSIEADEDYHIYQSPRGGAPEQCCRMWSCDMCKRRRSECGDYKEGKE